MTRAFIPKDSLAAFQRFELGAFGGGEAQPVASAESAPHADARSVADDIAAARDAARTEGHAEGLAAGYAAGAAEARREAERLRAIADAAATIAAAAERELAGDVLDLALEVARQILRADARVRRDALLGVVREALGALPQAVNAPALALNPGDVELVRAQIGDELAANGCRIIEDFRIEPGGCRVSSAACEVDATLATRWKRVVATLGKDTAWLDSADE
jgi:flagellar assembly protein FliH